MQYSHGRCFRFIWGLPGQQLVRSSFYPSRRPGGIKNLNFAAVKKFSWTNQPRPISKCKLVLDIYFRPFSSILEVMFFLKNGCRPHTPIGTWYPRLPTLFGESICSLLCQESDHDMILCTFIYICFSQILLRKRPEIKNFQDWLLLLSWCEDREILGFITGWQCLGNVTMFPRASLLALLHMLPEV